LAPEIVMKQIAVKLIHPRSELLLNYLRVKDPDSGEYFLTLRDTDRQKCQDMFLSFGEKDTICLKYRNKICIARQMPNLKLVQDNERSKYYLELFDKKIEEFGTFSDQDTLILNVVSRSNFIN
jgi:hypothetical protein